MRANLLSRTIAGVAGNHQEESTRCPLAGSCQDTTDIGGIVDADRKRRRSLANAPGKVTISATTDLPDGNVVRTTFEMPASLLDRGLLRLKHASQNTLARSTARTDFSHMCIGCSAAMQTTLSKTVHESGRPKNDCAKNPVHPELDQIDSCSVCVSNLSEHFEPGGKLIERYCVVLQIAIERLRLSGERLFACAPLFRCCTCAGCAHDHDCCRGLCSPNVAVLLLAHGGGERQALWPQRQGQEDSVKGPLWQISDAQGRRGE